MVVVDSLVVFSFTAGAASFFAPCAFPLLPGYVAYFLGTEGDADLRLPRRLWRAVVVGTVTSVGAFLVFGALAAVTAVFGTGALADIAVLELVIGAVLVVLGAGMATGRFTGSVVHVRLPERQRSVAGFFLFGMTYAAAAAGCTAFLFVAAVGQAVRSPPATAAAIVAAYGLGMGALMVLVTFLSALGKETVLRRLSRKTGTLTRAGGVVLVAAGLVQMAFFFEPALVTRYLFDPFVNLLPL